MIEQRPTIQTKQIEVVTCVIMIGFFIWVLTLAHGLPWYATAIGLAIPTFSFYQTVRSITLIICAFDKKLNLLTVKRKNWFGEKVIQHYLNEIQTVRIKVVQVVNDNEPSDTFEIGIVLASGFYVRLNEASTSFDRINTEAIVSSIESFLNLHHLSI